MFVTSPCHDMPTFIIRQRPSSTPLLIFLQLFLVLKEEFSSFKREYSTSSSCNVEVKKYMKLKRNSFFSHLSSQFSCFKRENSTFSSSCSQKSFQRSWNLIFSGNFCHRDGGNIKKMSKLFNKLVPSVSYNNLALSSTPLKSDNIQ